MPSEIVYTIKAGAIIIVSVIAVMILWFTVVPVVVDRFLRLKESIVGTRR